MDLCLLVTLSLILCSNVFGLPLKSDQEDKPINRIVIPYAPYSTDLGKNLEGKTKNVSVPVEKDIVPKIDLREDQVVWGRQKGKALNLAQGEYPVYYVPGNANGNFHNAMIYLLE